MKKSVYVVSIASMVLMFIFFGTFISTKLETMLILGISALVICYNFTVRLVVIALCNVYCTPESINPDEHRFQPKRFERGLYKAIRIRRWKKLFPNYDPNRLSIRTHSVDELIFEGCKAELIHRYGAVLGFLSLLFAIFLGSISIFIVTAVIGAVYDLSFIAVQRFNRPRLRKIAAAGKYN